MMAVTGYGSNTSLTLLPPGSVGPVPALNPNLTFEDLNPSVGGVNRGTNIGSSFTDVYSVTGQGLFFGFLLTLENMEDEWFIRLLVDENEIFGGAGISTKDLEKNDRYGYDKGGDDDGPFMLGFDIHDKTVRWQSIMNYPIAYASSVEIKIRYKSSSKKFKAGLAVRTA